MKDEYYIRVYMTHDTYKPELYYWEVIKEKIPMPYPGTDKIKSGYSCSIIQAWEDAYSAYNRIVVDGVEL